MRWRRSGTASRRRSDLSARAGRTSDGGQLKTILGARSTPAIIIAFRQKPSPRLLVNLPPDQHAADFAGAGADLVELGVAQQPAGREIVDVAVAAQGLDRLQRHPGRTLGSVEDGAGGVFTGNAAVVAGARDRIDICLG